MTEQDTNREELVGLLRRWEKPPADMVGRLPRKGGGGSTVWLDYLGHAAVTRILTETDPLWSWELVAWAEDGTPLIRAEGKRLVLWGRLTILGRTVLCCGTCEASKWEPEKELIGDLIRNGAMRFGVGLSLWAKEEWTALDVTPGEAKPQRETKARKPRTGPVAVAPEPTPEPAAEPAPPSGPSSGPPVPAVTTGAQRAKALKRARELAEGLGVAPPSNWDDLTTSSLWAQVADDLGLAS